MRGMETFYFHGILKKKIPLFNWGNVSDIELLYIILNILYMVTHYFVCTILCVRVRYSWFQGPEERT